MAGGRGRYEWFRRQVWMQCGHESQRWRRLGWGRLRTAEAANRELIGHPDCQEELSAGSASLWQASAAELAKVLCLAIMLMIIHILRGIDRDASKITSH